MTEDECRNFLINLYKATAGKGKDSKIRWGDNLVISTIPREGVVYQLRYDIWAIRSIITHPDMEWYRCNN